jgi:hypothetical protein
MITEVAESADLCRLLRMGIGRVRAAVTGRSLAPERLLSLVVSIREALSRRCAQNEAFAVQYEGELAELDLLCSWPEDEDEFEFALRFEGLGEALLRAVAGPDGAEN